MGHTAGQIGEKERVRDASDIVRVIGEHIALRPRGREYVGLCPFHDDHHPSMTVVPAKQIFHCFVCGAGGDVFSFVQRFYRMEFREALEYLAERAGIVLSRPAVRAPDSGDLQPGRTDLLRAHALALEFFRATLRHAQQGQAARSLIAARGISAEMVQRFEIGAAPAGWDGLVSWLERRGADLRPFVAAGLIRRRETGDGHYDAFRHRLVFPIHDQTGRVVAFGARRIAEDDEPKYLNSPESRLFIKGATLYGLHHAAREIQRQRTAVVTEGYTDAVACHQAGFANVVATLGTALTMHHASVLRRICDTVVLLFDSDQAGLKAADRAVEIFFTQQLDVRIATLDGLDAKDPDELLRRHGGAEALRAALARARDVLAYRYDRMRQEVAGAGPGALARTVEQELARLVQLGLNRLPALRRALIVRRLADITGVEERVIARTIPSVARERPSSGGVSVTARAMDPSAARRGLSPLERALGCVLCDPTLVRGRAEAHMDALAPARFDAGPARLVAQAVWDLETAGRPWNLPDVMTRLGEQSGACELAAALYAGVREETEGDPVRLRAMLQDCLQLASPARPAVSLENVRRARAADVANRRVLPRP